MRRRFAGQPVEGVLGEFPPCAVEFGAGEAASVDVTAGPAAGGVEGVAVVGLLRRREPDTGGDGWPSFGWGGWVFTLIHVDAPFVGSPPGWRPTLPGGSAACNCRLR